MNTAHKLENSRFSNPLFSTRDHLAGDIVSGLQLLGWTNLPVLAVKSIEDDIRLFLQDLVTKSSSCDVFVAKRRRKILFWVDSYLRGECTLNWLMEMLDRLPATSKNEA